MTSDKEIVEQTKGYVRQELEGESSGHDWWHIHRVYNNALTIAQTERADEPIVSLAALLHDIADYKLHDGDCDIGPKVARAWLERQGMDEPRITHVCKIIKDMSFKGAETASTMNTIEGKIVQDADRLDAIGAIGIARAFAVGGYMGREIYNPDVKPTMHKSFDEYKASKSSTINHFHEKLLLLKDLMNTETAKKMADERHVFMIKFLEQFHKEWSGI